MTQIEKFAKLPKIMELSGKGRSTIYADVKNGTFPAPVKIGARAVAWRMSDIAEWQEACINASKAA